MSSFWSKEIQSTEMLYYSRMSRFNDCTKQAWFDLLAIKDGDRVLEVGCGGGHFCNMIKQQYPNCKVYGIDLDEGHIAFARQKSKDLGIEINYKIADIKELPFENDFFDVVFSYTVVEHMPFDEFIKEQCRVIKPNGKVQIMGVATYEKIHSNKYDYLAIELDDILQKLKYNESTKVGNYLAFPEEIMKNLIQYGFLNCIFSTKKIIYYNPDCQSDLEVSLSQINNEYISDNANNMFCLNKAINGNEYRHKILELSEQRYKRRIELLKNNYKIFDYLITNVFCISAKKTPIQL